MGYFTVLYKKLKEEIADNYFANGKIGYYFRDALYSCALGVSNQ